MSARTRTWLMLAITLGNLAMLAVSVRSNLETARIARATRDVCSGAGERIAER
jgi:hypothetical protein